MPRSLYLDGGKEVSNLISDQFLEVDARWNNLKELILLYCYFPARAVCEFLFRAGQHKRRHLSPLIVQLKPFFADCDFSSSWFSQALGPFLSLVAVSSVELFNERYEYTEYSLQYNPSRSGTVFSVFCEQGKLQLDIWFIDQDDEPGNEDSLFFWENFEANRP
ncbi:hypothetical protein BT69DRAFT_1332805 [Atractiella rhizophila]|nr:hypothetical protein BT69DRAFT_1332805 [Atractiella rhizophila]